MTDNERKVTPISDLGEFGLIDRLTNKIKIRNASTLKGIGDDAAVIESKNKKIVVSNEETESRGTQYVTLDTTQEQYQSINYYAYEVIENVNQDSIIIIFDGGEQMIVPKDDVEYWFTW